MHYFLFDNHSKKLKELFPETARVLDEAATVGGCLGVVDEENELAGYLVVFPSIRRQSMLRISEMKVAKEYRRRGIGSELVENAKKLALSQGYTELGMMVEIGESKVSNEEYFIESTGFDAAKREYCVLCYKLDDLRNSKIIEFANLNKDVLPEVRNIPNNSQDLILRFEKKCEEQGYYFERNFYDSMLTSFCISENDIVGVVSLEVQGNGHLRISDWYKDQTSKINYIEPALIKSAVQNSLEFFDTDTILELCIDREDDAAKYIQMLGEPLEQKLGREYYFNLR